MDETLSGNMAPRSTIWLARSVPLLAGLVQGAVILRLSSLPRPHDPLQDTLWMSALYATFIIQMTWPGAAAGQAARWRSLCAALTIILVLGLCQYWSIGAWKDADIAPAEVLLTIALLLALPLLQGLVVEGLRLPAYARLFGRAVDSVLAVLIGLFCLGVYSLLLVLWGALFRLLDLNEIAALLTGEKFESFSMSLAWTLGILATREHSGILDRLLRLCSVLARGLLPLVVLIAASFFLALPFTGLTPVWQRGGSGLLFAIAAAGTIFVNGVYQAGGERYAPWQKRLVETAILIIAVAVGLAAYGSVTRISQYGLTPDRVLLLAGVTTAALVSAGYVTAAVWRRGAWLAGLGHVNRLALPAIILLLIALTGPVLDPVAMSARSQYHRLADQLVSASRFDFGYLQFRLGPAGRERLTALENLDGHPEGTTIRIWAGEARQAPSYWEWQRRNPAPTTAPSYATPAAPPVTAAVPEDSAPPPAALERATGVTGPLALSGETRWRAGPSPRLYVVVTGHVGFRREGESESLRQYAAVFRAEPNEMITLEPSGRAAVLIVELESAQ